jgi:uncharacterized UBP type Zn finger protein
MYFLQIDSKINFPLQELDMAPFSSNIGCCSNNGSDGTDTTCDSKLSSDESIPYHLVGIVTHIGTLAMGHYVAYALKSENNSNSWLRYEEIHMYMNIHEIDMY